MSEQKSTALGLVDDPRFRHAVDLFNAGDWYPAHDAFEELWHETSGPERKTLQGVIQVAVAQLHLERGNRRGATLLYGEGLGRFKAKGIPDLGWDLEQLCLCIQDRLQKLQQQGDPDSSTVPVLLSRN
ncbi:MAG: DUF309 domain-containing protein [Prochlorococcaceae cyanobacterium ETNP18_MAG_1]|nr:DUF309 domain-containing protein [Prochlorococcaceae cyanobacterium ETNP18_MAG_1]